MNSPSSPPSPERPRFLRQFALTQGRGQSIDRDLPLESLVTALPVVRQNWLTPEQRLIVEMCVGPRSIAEISSHLHVHLGVARILVSDMVANGLASVVSADNDTGPDLDTLERLLNDLQRL